MPTDNVVPIDAEVARSIARRAIRFRWFVAALAGVWLGTLIPVLLFTPLPPLVPFLVLGALLVLAEHRFVLFGLSPGGRRASNFPATAFSLLPSRLAVSDIS